LLPRNPPPSQSIFFVSCEPHTTPSHRLALKWRFFINEVNTIDCIVWLNVIRVVFIIPNSSNDF
jgi:hypothetical protein